MMTIKGEAALKASLAKFNDKCYLEAQKLKMVYILCYKEKPEYPTFAQRLSDAATGENGQPYLLHSTSETDLVGKLKSKLLTRLTTDLQHIKEGFKARDHWTTNLIAGPMCSQEFIDEIQVADPGRTPRSLSNPGPEKYLEEFDLGDIVCDKIIISDKHHPMRKVNDLIQHVIDDIRKIKPVYESFRASSHVTAKELLWGADIKNWRKNEIVEHVNHAAIVAITHDIAECLLNVGDALIEAESKKLHLPAEGVLSSHSKSDAKKRKKTATTSSSESCPLQTTSSSTSPTPAAHSSAEDRQLQDLLDEQGDMAKSLSDLLIRRQANQIDDASFETLKSFYNNSMKRIQEKLDNLK